MAILGMLAYPRRSTAIFGGLLLLGGVIEGLQALTPYRLAEWTDWIPDGIGTVAGQAAVFSWRRWSGRHRE